MRLDLRGISAALHPGAVVINATFRPKWSEMCIRWKCKWELPIAGLAKMNEIPSIRLSVKFLKKRQRCSCGRKAKWQRTVRKIRWSWWIGLPGLNPSGNFIDRNEASGRVPYRPLPESIAAPSASESMELHSSFPFNRYPACACGWNLLTESTPATPVPVTWSQTPSIGTMIIGNLWIIWGLYWTHFFVHVMSNIYEDECTFIKSIIYFVWRGGGGGGSDKYSRAAKERMRILETFYVHKRRKWGRLKLVTMSADRWRWGAA